MKFGTINEIVHRVMFTFSERQTDRRADCQTDRRTGVAMDVTLVKATTFSLAKLTDEMIYNRDYTRYLYVVIVIVVVVMICSSFISIIYASRTKYN